jgi:hypothetical protein
MGWKPVHNKKFALNGCGREVVIERGIQGHSGRFLEDGSNCHQGTEITDLLSIARRPFPAHGTQHPNFPNLAMPLPASLQSIILRIRMRS